MPLRYVTRIRRFLFGKPRDLFDEKTFHRVTLVAVLAWIGLGGDGLSSSCYGPEEAFLSLAGHRYLAVFLAVAVTVTVTIISLSYTRIIEHFPSGGGGYSVATKLISPKVGMVAGSALIVDYILTVAMSIASGADALFSFLPMGWHPYKFYAIIGILAIMVLLNLRGVRESVLPIVPVFGLFLLTHVFAIGYSIFANLWGLGDVAAGVVVETKAAVGTLGLFGTFIILMRAYSLGAGTFTGIEAVSNSLPILRVPKVDTARKTMLYMAISLSFVASGLLVAYLIFSVVPEPGKTLNAALFHSLSAPWPPALARVFVFVTLGSEAAILVVAAQTGFLDAPRVMANMAVDNWLPRRFSNLSERLVIQDGVIVIGVAAFLILLFTGASVKLLVVLYAINVFITFTLSQFGMARRLWRRAEGVRHRIRDALITTTGFCLTGFVLVAVVILKFHEGGWATLLVTGSVVAFCFLVKRHYRLTAAMFSRLDSLVEAFKSEPEYLPKADREACQRSGLTAVLLVESYSGLGLHLLLAALRLFGGRFRKIVFAGVGVIDAWRFKGVDEVVNLEGHVRDELAKYVRLMKQAGYDAEAVSAVGTDVPDEIEKLAEQLQTKYSGLIFFVGQLMFEEETPITRFLHSYTAFAVQKRLYRLGLPLVTLPVRIPA